MGPLNITDEERKAMSKQHKDATQKQHDRKQELKKGIQPKKTKEKPTE